MTEIIQADIKTIASNPYRRLHAYPYIESKIEALSHSIGEVGLWPSIIARPLGDHQLWKYEIAFGHHRMEAARRHGLTEIPLIIEPLSDKQMLQYMGRENLEDYNAYFLIQLESWEAVFNSGLIASTKERLPQPIEVARLLGWTRVQSSGSVILNTTAAACHPAYMLIQGGYMAREQFTDLSVAAARDIAERAYARIQQVENTGKTHQFTAREIESDKQKVGRGARDTADQVRRGTVSARDIRSRVDFNTAARVGQRPSPLFAVFANAVTENLKRTITADADAEKLANIEKVLGQISLLEDWEALRRLKVELVNLSERASAWDRRLEPTKEKVVQLRALERGSAGR